MKAASISYNLVPSVCLCVCMSVCMVWKLEKHLEITGKINEKAKVSNLKIFILYKSCYVCLKVKSRNEAWCS